MEALRVIAAPHRRSLCTRIRISRRTCTYVCILGFFSLGFSFRVPTRPHLRFYEASQTLLVLNLPVFETLKIRSKVFAFVVIFRCLGWFDFSVQKFTYLNAGFRWGHIQFMLGFFIDMFFRIIFCWVFVELADLDMLFVFRVRIIGLDQTVQIGAALWYNQ